jgi:phosphoglycerol transferase
MPPEVGSPRAGVVRTIAARLGGAAALGVAAIIGALAIYRPWGWRVHVPFSTAFDTQLNAIFIRNVLGGSVYSAAQLGAPFGQHLQDFPVGGDRWSFLLVRAIGLVSHDPYTVLNIFFILGFGLIAACTYLVARELHLGVTTSSVVALLSAFLPYHFWRGEMHVWLSNYVGQPLMVLLAVWVLRDELRLPFLHRHRGPWSSLERRRFWIAVAATLVLGGTGGYYAMFAVCTLAAAGIVAQARRRSWRTLATGVVVAGGVAVVLGANLAPELIWRARHGVDHQVAQRLLVENDDYALRLVRLILPGPDHRFAPFAWIGGRTVRGEGGESAGIIAALGLLGGWLLLLVRGLRVRPAEAGRDGSTRDHSLPLALAVISAFLFLLGTAGGLGYVIAIFATPQFRGWDRVALPLALCGLLTAGWWVDRWNPKLDRRRVTAVAGAAVVLALGLLDQIPSGVTPTYDVTRAQLHSTRAFVAQMAHSLPPGAMVFQFPVVGFPENEQVGNMIDYELAKPYIVGGDRLRWSYGGIRGREADWQVWWDQQPLEARVAGIAAAGFDAIYLDRRAYAADGGKAMMTGLAEAAGPAVATSIDGHLAWFDLRPLRRRLEQATSEARVRRAGKLILHGVTATYDGDVSPNLDALGSQHRLVGSTAGITFTNPLDEARTIDVRTTWGSTSGAVLHLVGTDPPRTHALQNASSEVDFTLRLPANGSRTVGISLTGRGQPNGGVDFRVYAELRSLVFDEADVRAVVGVASDAGAR